MNASLSGWEQPVSRAQRRARQRRMRTINRKMAKLQLQIATTPEVARPKPNREGA